jgi:TldD protein
MKDLASAALDSATHLGASYADVRIIDERSRVLATKNGKIGTASDARSQGFNVRVIVNGAWGFASSADLGRSSVDATAKRAVEIAQASAKVKQSDVKLVAEGLVTADWTTPHEIDPFTTSVEQNLTLLQKIDAELRSVKGVTLAETNMNFRHDEQWFFSSEGSDIHQSKYTSGAGYVAYSFAEARFRSAHIQTPLAGSGRAKDTN